MYPFIRFLKSVISARRMPPLEGFHAIHESHHICWPWDLDMFAELNNGRALTLYDLGRFMLGRRVGFDKALRRNKWALAVAGSTIRYRRRLTIFEPFTMRTRLVCWDDRFMYLEQSMWKRNGDCASHVLVRAAIVERGKMIPPARAVEAMGIAALSPPMPQWITAWVKADAERPWPPMQNSA